MKLPVNACKLIDIADPNQHGIAMRLETFSGDKHTVLMSEAQARYMMARLQALLTPREVEAM